MAPTGKLPKLSSFVIQSLNQIGFKQIADRPYEFIGSVKGQHDDYGMAALLTVMPLKLQKRQLHYLARHEWRTDGESSLS
jgi:hypothetical protein